MFLLMLSSLDDTIDDALRVTTIKEGVEGRKKHTRTTLMSDRHLLPKVDKFPKIFFVGGKGEGG